MGFPLVNMREGGEEGGGRTQRQRGKSECGNKVPGVFGTQDMAGEFLEVSLERLVGVRARRSQILRERDPLKVHVHLETLLLLC